MGPPFFAAFFLSALCTAFGSWALKYCPRSECQTDCRPQDARACAGSCPFAQHRHCAPAWFSGRGTVCESAGSSAPLCESLLGFNLPMSGTILGEEPRIEEEEPLSSVSSSTRRICLRLACARPTRCMKDEKHKLSFKLEHTRTRMLRTSTQFSLVACTSVVYEVVSGNSYRRHVDAWCCILKPST